jgi:hypothetical protein
MHFDILAGSRQIATNALASCACEALTMSFCKSLDADVMEKGF